MIYEEVYKNIFTVNKKYALGQCISEDVDMGEGIATDFDKQFKGMKKYILNTLKDNNLHFPVTILYQSNKGNVFNLITKKVCSGKPNYITIGKCLEEMAKICKDQNIKYLALPKIGSGLDRLQWGEIREIIQEEFKDQDIEILVCRYHKK
jgi:O-acetyl-ADP-ribose deacetylase (regulator of RNase III)